MINAVNNQITTYQNACKYLDDMQMHKIKLGLEAMQTILAELGSPERSCPAVHVAGTNGKGSVCSMIRSIMTEAGYKTGLYTSPHLSSVRERFRIDDQYIPEDDFTRLMEKIRCALKERTITYFECATALAFCWFAEQSCDLIIIETGLGGRLDATNVLKPLISVITTISMDHEQYLGDSVESVAYEKAGIIKEKTPVISGVLADGPRAVIEQTCSARQAPLYSRNSDYLLETAGDSTWRWRDKDDSLITNLTLPPGGVWQAENGASAVAAVVLLRDLGFEIPDIAIRIGLKNALWPGRMELLKVALHDHGDKYSKVSDSGQFLRFLLDGAHNEAGVSSLVEALETSFNYQRLLVIWASMGDKKYDDMLNAVAIKADHLILTSPDSERSAAPEELAAVLLEAADKSYECISRVSDALTKIKKMATPDDLVVVAGSLYLIGEFRKLLVGEVVS